MKQKLLTLFLALAASVGTLFAQSGTCGDNLTWTLSSGTLTISGTGAMTNYTYSNSSGKPNTPWYSYNSSIKTVIIEDGVASIGNYAFYFCTNLTSVTIPNSVTSIGEYAFYYCSSLTSITIPNSVSSIGNYAFSSCSNLTSITIPNSVTTIGNHAFDGCSSLTSITIPNSVTSIENYAFGYCSSLTSSTIPNSVTSIGNYAFDYCSSLTSITIPNSVTSIGEYAFFSCSSLTSVTIPNSVTSIGIYAFSGCSSLTSVTWNAIHCSDVNSFFHPFGNIHLKITSFVFGDDVEYIPANLCYEMENASIVVPNCSVEIGPEAFEGCTSVLINKLPDCTIITKDEIDTPNSGSLTFNFAGYYKYAGTYYYTLNGEKNASLQNLTAGKYKIVFHGDICGDSIVKNITINQYGMRVEGMYYLLDDENHTATLTYRGASYSDYSNEYSGNITIPESITFNGQDYKVTGIGASAFSGCNVTSVTMISKQPVTISNSCGLGNAVVYVPFGSLSDYKKTSYWYNYNLHVINPSHSSSSSSATSATITLGNSEEAKHIASCGMEGGEEFAGNVIEYIGLEPNSEYADVPFFVKTKEGDYDNIKATFKTTALTLTTLASKAVSNTTSILLAETNMSDSETSCGFEWRRNDQPADMPSNQVLCPVANGLMAGRLKGLKDDVYYKYRAFYKSAAGNMFYGAWQYVFTGDVTVEFDPVLYTYAAQFVSERKATLKGYALAGSDDFTEQGFEYWAESRRTDAPARRAPQYAIGEKHTVKGTGISMRVTLEDLDEGTVYKYRTYAKVGDKTLYGAEMTFTTQGTYEDPIETDLDLIPDADADETDLTPTPRTPQARKYIRNGVLFIERNGITYTAQGHRID